MFTGIIEEIGTVKSVRKGSESVVLEIEAGIVTSDMKRGDSISVNGVCLTIVTFSNHGFLADVMPESMRRTNFGGLFAGSRVNLERALRLTDRLGGHLVSGHIDGMGVIRNMKREDNAVVIKISAANELLRYIVEKGSVAVDGISLTITAVTGSTFSVSVIPHTFDNTSLGLKRTGDELNIECDMIAKYVEKLANQGREQGKITPEFLAEYGFL